MDKLICLKIYTKIIGLRIDMPSFHLERNFRDYYSYKTPKMKVHHGNADHLFTSPVLARHINAHRRSVRI